MGKNANLNQMWNGQLACLLIHNDDLMLQQIMEGASVYSFALIRRGHLTVNYNGQKIELNPNDIHTYAPGMPTEMVHVSNDYEGYCMIIDEQLVYHTPLMNHLIRAAYQPIAEFCKPLFTLSDEQAKQMWSLLSILREHILHPIDFQRESLLAICEVFCIDLINIQNIMVEHHRINSRFEQVFSDFLQLVPDNFMRHHDLKFYADQLNISSTYLSRIVKIMSARTVMSFIDNALAIEASKRLKTTKQSITEMAFDFGFSDQAAFTKFFTRMKGISPREYRNKQ